MDVRQTIIKEIERRLHLEFPEELADFLGPQQGRAYFAEWEGLFSDADDGDESMFRPMMMILWVDLELLLVRNLELRWCADERGRDRPADALLTLGSDGCGNYYFVDTTIPSHPFLFLDHETDEMDTRFASLSELLPRMPWADADISCEEPSSDPDVLVVTRTDKAWRSPLEPIGLQEWRDYVAASSDIVMHEYRDGVNPFTGEPMPFEEPGSARWSLGGKEIPLQRASGCIEVFVEDLDEADPKAGRRRLAKIAADLDANLLDPGQ